MKPLGRLEQDPDVHYLWQLATRNSPWNLSLKVQVHEKLLNRPHTEKRSEAFPVLPLLVQHFARPIQKHLGSFDGFRTNTNVSRAVSGGGHKAEQHGGK